MHRRHSLRVIGFRRRSFPNGSLSTMKGGKGGIPDLLAAQRYRTAQPPRFWFHRKSDHGLVRLAFSQLALAESFANLGKL